MYVSENAKVTLDDRGHRKGITALAKRLNVSYGHLYQVLTGKRHSARLIRIVSQIQPELIIKE